MLWFFFFEEKGREVVWVFGGDLEILFVLFVKMINDVVVDCFDDLVIMMYICCGNFCLIWVVLGGYDVVVEIILDGLNLDGLFLEYDDDCFGNFDLFCFVKCKNL